MAKYCPECGLVYPDAARYCDQEGADLIDADSADAPQSRYHLWKILIPGIVFLVIALGGTFFYLASQARGQIKLTLQGFSLPPAAGGELGSAPKVTDRLLGAARALTGTGDVLAQVKVKNDTSWSGKLLSASYVVYVNDREIGRGQWTAPAGAPVVVRGGQETVLDLPIQLHPGASLSGIFDALLGKEPTVKMQGSLLSAIAFFKFEVPFEFTQVQLEAPTKQLPTF